MSEQQATQATQPEQTQATQPVEPQKDPATGKYIHMYQPKDADGNAFGKEYKYLYTDNADLVKQLQEGKEQGDRWIHEVKAGKRQVNGEKAQPVPDYKPAPDSADDTDKRRREEFRKTFQEEFGTSVEDGRERFKQQRGLESRTAAYNWALNKQADGYYPCTENAKKISEYLKTHDLANTPANYDIAFDDLKSELIATPEESKQSASDSPKSPNEQSSGSTQTPDKTQSTGIIPGQFQSTRPEKPGSKPPLSAERYRAIDKLGHDAFMKLERTNKAEYNAFLLMKIERSQPQQ